MGSSRFKVSRFREAEFARVGRRGPWHLIDSFIFEDDGRETFCGSLIADHWKLANEAEAHAESKERWEASSRILRIEDDPLEPGMIFPLCRNCNRSFKRREGLDE